ncbi:MAG: response regulator [Hespellia sp.]|nr:response regulator [Hespellia sp.]
MRTILNISICDDRPDQLAKIYTATTEYFKKYSERVIQVSRFDNSLLFLESLDKTGGCDIALLDICMPGILGTDVARSIRARCDKTEIIFLTSSDEYAIDAFVLKAAHYLLKPFTQEQFNEAMDRAMQPFADGSIKNIAVKRDSIVLRSGHRIPIPKRGFRNLESTYFDYMFREGDFK